MLLASELWVWKEIVLLPGFLALHPRTLYKRCGAWQLSALKKWTINFRLHMNRWSLTYRKIGGQTHVKFETVIWMNLRELWWLSSKDRNPFNSMQNSLKLYKEILFDKRVQVTQFWTKFHTYSKAYPTMAHFAESRLKTVFWMTLSTIKKV